MTIPARLLLLPVPVLLIGCAPLTISGANAPTDDTFELTAADIEAAESDECAIEWVTKDAEANRDRALAELKKRGVEIKARKSVKFTTAFRNELHVGKNWSENSVVAQANILTHELVHYCQRDTQGDNAFDAAYAHSRSRWRTEVPAYSQSIRTMRAQGYGPNTLTEFIDRQIIRLQEAYWLFDIDPEQYERETRRIWSAVAGLTEPQLDEDATDEGDA